MEPSVRLGGIASHVSRVSVVGGRRMGRRRRSAREWVEDAVRGIKLLLSTSTSGPATLGTRIRGMLGVHRYLVVLLGVEHHLLVCPLRELVVGIIERAGIHLGLMAVMHVGRVRRSVLIEARVVGSVGGGPAGLLLVYRVRIRLLLGGKLLAGLLGHRGRMVGRIRGRRVLLSGRGLIGGCRGVHSLRR